MRIALSFALIMMIISEIAGATNGVGLRLIEDVTFFNIPDLWATMVFLAVIGFIFNGAMSLMEGRLLRWQQEAARSQDA